MIKVKAEVKHIGPDHMARVQAAIKKAHGSFVSVGWPANKKYPGEDTTVAQVALFNEFGTYSPDGRPHVPARPFMRPAIDENKKRLEELRVDAVTKVAFLGASIESSLEELGNAAKAMIVAKINSNVPPPNAPSTLARKAAKGHGDQTLIDSGLMRDSIEVKVTLNAQLRHEKELALKQQTEQAHDAHKRAQARQAYRKKAQADKAKQKEARTAQRSAQKAVSAQTKKAGKAIRKAGKTIKKFAAKKQKSASKNIKKGVVQVAKGITASVKAAAKSASKSVRNAANRISKKQSQRTRSKPDSTDKE